MVQKNFNENLTKSLKKSVSGKQVEVIFCKIIEKQKKMQNQENLLECSNESGPS